jgi:hypothetical protein
MIKKLLALFAFAAALATATTSAAALDQEEPEDTPAPLPGPPAPAPGNVHIAVTSVYVLDDGDAGGSNPGEFDPFVFELSNGVKSGSIHPKASSYLSAWYGRTLYRLYTGQHVTTTSPSATTFVGKPSEHVSIWFGHPELDWNEVPFPIECEPYCYVRPPDAQLLVPPVGTSSTSLVQYYNGDARLRFTVSLTTKS